MEPEENLVSYKSLFAQGTFLLKNLNLNKHYLSPQTNTSSTVHTSTNALWPRKNARNVFKKHIYLPATQDLPPKFEIRQFFL